MIFEEQMQRNSQEAVPFTSHCIISVLRSKKINVLTSYPPFDIILWVLKIRKEMYAVIITPRMIFKFLQVNMHALQCAFPLQHNWQALPQTLSETWQTDNWHVEASSWQSWHCLSSSHHTTTKKEMVVEFYYYLSHINNYLPFVSLDFVLKRCCRENKGNHCYAMYHNYNIRHRQVQV